MEAGTNSAEEAANGTPWYAPHVQPMIDRLECRRCKTLIPVPENMRVPYADVVVACTMESCGWRGPAYEAVPGHQMVMFEEHKKTQNKTCPRCGNQSGLSWSVARPGHTGTVHCMATDCGYWAEAF